jgi:putative ABC transport system ATP-binding protein
METGSLILECRKISRTFAGNGSACEVIKDLDFTLRAKETAVISGKSGAGKSVLLWMLALLDPPDSGEILFDGTAVRTRSPEGMAKARRGKVSIIFQDYNLIPSWTALENVTAVFAGTKMKKSEQIRSAGSLLSTLGLGDKLSNLPAELSIGQRQRVAIARSIILSPRLIIADEPTGGLDPQTGDEIVELLLDCVQRSSCGLVVATHGCFPLDAADSVYSLKEGRLAGVNERPA